LILGNFGLSPSVWIPNNAFAELAITNVGLATSIFDIRLDGNTVAFSVSESAQDGTDLNGDGDTSDFVLHVYDISGDATTNVGLTTTFGLQLDGNTVVNPVIEFIQGDTDLNEDGDTTDVVLHVYDVSGDTTTNVGLAMDFGGQLDGNTVAFLVSESDQDGTDLNEDGDSSDSVLHLALTAEQQIENIEDQVSDSLDKKDAEKVTKTLDKAIKNIDEGKTDKACKDMDKFIKEVKKLFKKGKLTEAEKDALIDDAEAVKTALECV